ncbi:MULTISPECIES: hypothetical protein [Pectobacterium]|uniref:hypothetical protein n=1 Tax=Pectobacterium TaxID=122277 RepID=UPI003018BF81
MGEAGDLFIKYIIPVVTTIISVIGLFKGWVYQEEKLFSRREKMSKFIYDLYKVSQEESLKKLAIDYGYAAITKDNFLSTEQRIALINSRNPTRDIDSYRKCSSLLNISINPLGFEWRSKRHQFKLYRVSIYITNALLYLLGCAVSALPFVYDAFLPFDMILRSIELSNVEKTFIAIYLFFSGAVVALVNLNGLSKLRIASDLRKRHIGGSIS